MENKEQDYTFPWGFHLGELNKDGSRMPLYTPSNDGGFCLLYDKISEKKVDTLLECLCLELLSTMPHESLKVNLLDFGKKKFYALSPLQYMNTYKVSHNDNMIARHFKEIEETIISRHKDLLCCNRQTINEHNKKSKMKQEHHLLLINLDNFPTQEIELLRIKNFVASACAAGVYVIAFGYHEMAQSENEGVQTILNHFKNIKVSNNEFDITAEVFEFQELLADHTFEPLDMDKDALLLAAMENGDLESFMDPENIKLEKNTKVK